MDAKILTTRVTPDVHVAGATVGAGLVKGLIDVAVARGANRDVLMERSGIALADLEDPDKRIPFSKYVALMRTGQELCNDPALALHFGETVNMADMSIVGSLGDSATISVVAGLEKINRYSRLVIDVDVGGSGDRLQIVREKTGMWLVDNRINPNDFPEITESSFARMICWTRAFSEPGRPLVKAMQVTHAKPAHADEYDRVLQVPVTFGATRNAVLLDETWRPRDYTPPSRYIAEILNERADQLLADLEKAKTVRGRVESYVTSMLHTGDVGVETVARKMGLSRKTLYLRLKAEGVTYERLLDALRQRMARHYLNDRKLSVNETAYLVGFSDPTAFSRAFKRWTGKSPKNRA